MSDPFIAEIKIFSFPYAPKGWAFCNGQLLPINQNQALFSLLGTTYGGDGRVNFALPNLQGRVAMHMDDAHLEGEVGGEAAHTLTVSEMSTHSHGLMAAAPANGNSNTNIPTNGFFSNSAPAEIYNSTGGTPPQVPLAASAISNYGGNQPHENMQPYLVLNFCIALVGIFPSRN